MPMSGASIHYRPETQELRDKIVERAHAKGLSVNEWLNRAVTHAILHGGKLKKHTVTTIEEI